MTGIDLYPISKFMGNSEGEKPFKFIIPNYQRGYRWGKEQVEELLSDLCEFYQDTTKNPKEIYCMQPLVVCEKTDTNENGKKETSYVVVDGQQRLTTLYILFRTISEIDKKDVFTISYDSRPESKDYLNDLFSETEEKTEERTEEKEKKKHLENPDFYYMYIAKKTIKEWDGWSYKYKDINKEIFCKEIEKRVHFIWYIVDCKDVETQINVFKRLNINRISLTESELIKAIILNENNLNVSEAESEMQKKKDELLSITEAANEWDQIEYQLQDDRFWLFFHENKYDCPTRIDFIFEMVYKQVLNADSSCKLDSIDNESKNNHKSHSNLKVFNYFYQKYKEYEDKSKFVKDYWSDTTRAIFHTLKEWYDDEILFHYIGYLCAVDDKSSADLISELYSEYQNKDKTEFERYLREKIKEKVENTLDLSQIYETNNKSKRQTRPLLLLHNVQTVIDQNANLIKDKKYGIPNFARFPFHLFKQEHWDIEHIRPNNIEVFTGPRRKNSRRKYWYVHNEKMRNKTPSLANKFNYYDVIYKASIKEKIDINDIKDIQSKSISKDLSAVINKFEEYTKAGKDTKEQESKLKDKLSVEEESAFVQLWNDINENDADELNSNHKNLVWNYVLLDSSTNREYGNSCYAIKRDFVMKKENGIKPKLEIQDSDGNNCNVKQSFVAEMAFVPICTLRVFSKAYTDYPDNLQYWTTKDAACYRMDIEKRLWWYLLGYYLKDKKKTNFWLEFSKEYSEGDLHRIYNLLWNHYHNALLSGNEPLTLSMFKYYSKIDLEQHMELKKEIWWFRREKIWKRRKNKDQRALFLVAKEQPEEQQKKIYEILWDYYTKSILDDKDNGRNYEKDLIKFFSDDKHQTEAIELLKEKGINPIVDNSGEL